MQVGMLSSFTRRWLPRHNIQCERCGEVDVRNVDFFRKINTAGETPACLPAHQLDPFGPNGAERFDVFISHAGPDKLRIAEPLYRALEREGLRCFLDYKCLEPGTERAGPLMERALAEAQIGIFILSPEFATRWWPMHELDVLLKRNANESGDASSQPTLVPVFFRLDVYQCRNYYERSGNETGEEVGSGKFRDDLNGSDSVGKEPGKQNSVQHLSGRLRDIAQFPGIESFPAGTDRDERARLSDASIAQNVVEKVLNDAIRRGLVPI